MLKMLGSDGQVSLWLRPWEKLSVCYKASVYELLYETLPSFNAIFIDEDLMAHISSQMMAVNS